MVGRISYCSCLPVLPGLALVLLSYVLQTFILAFYFPLFVIVETVALSSVIKYTLFLTGWGTMGNMLFTYGLKLGQVRA